MLRANARSLNSFLNEQAHAVEGNREEWIAKWVSLPISSPKSISRVGEKRKSELPECLRDSYSVERMDNILIEGLTTPMDFNGWIMESILKLWPVEEKEDDDEATRAVVLRCNQGALLWEETKTAVEAGGFPGWAMGFICDLSKDMWILQNASGGKGIWWKDKWKDVIMGRTGLSREIISRLALFGEMFDFDASSKHYFEGLETAMRTRISVPWAWLFRYASADRMYVVREKVQSEWQKQGFM